MDAKLASELWNITKISNQLTVERPNIPEKSLSSGHIVKLKIELERIEEQLKNIKELLNKSTE